MLNDTSTDSLRPWYHFTPRCNWLNDPNGLVVIDGTYHIYYQYNPHGSAWGHMSWGHASSPDLVHWTEHPVALWCDSDEMVFSGSIVIDSDNTSGFGTDTYRGDVPLVAIYTSVAPNGRQAQALAYSTDGGYRWTKYADNPVVDRGSNEFRDPKVSRYVGVDGDEFWLMTVVEAVDRAVLFYRSDDLRDWTLLSSYSEPRRPVEEGQVWECPDLVNVTSDGGQDSAWVLLVSVNPGAPNGGSGTMYFVGEFDGCRFTPDSDTPRWLDQGWDYYAATSFSGTTRRQVLAFAWMSNWQYAHGVPTFPWRGGFTLPRELSLRTERGSDGSVQRSLGQQVPTAIAQQVKSSRPLAAEGSPLREPQLIDSGGRCRLRFAFEPGDADTVVVGLFAPLAPSDVGAAPAVTVTYVTATSELVVARRSTSATVEMDGFASTVTTPVALTAGRLELVLWIDAGSIEIQTADGSTWWTLLVFPEPGATGVTVEAVGGTAVIDRLQLDELKTSPVFD